MQRCRLSLPGRPTVQTEKPAILDGEGMSPTSRVNVAVQAMVVPHWARRWLNYKRSYQLGGEGRRKWDRQGRRGEEKAPYVPPDYGVGSSLHSSEAAWVEGCLCAPFYSHSFMQQHLLWLFSSRSYQLEHQYAADGLITFCQPRIPWTCFIHYASSFTPYPKLQSNGVESC